MAKTYLSAVKYNIVAEFRIDGIVDKPDIIGAIFGQSEGLIGQEMDLKQLQQNGKIGRIEIESNTVNGKTQGKIVVPSSMDMVQTSLLAAAVESVDKVGPCESKIEIKKIEDTRGQKRKAVSTRAQELLQQFMKEEIPESQEMTDSLMKSVRTAKIKEYGAEKLPAGPDIDSSEEIIVVEGRADVLNLLKYGITNVIGMEGSKVPKTLVKLAKTKTITAFVDGDRGGELNARHLQEVAKLDFVVRAPDGKEVEELAQKEIVMALRKKTTMEEAFHKKFNDSNQGYHGTEKKPFFKPRFNESRRTGFGDRRLGFGDRRNDSEDRRPNFGDRRNDSEDRRPNFGDRRNDSEDRRPNFGDRRNDSEDRKPGFGDRRPSFRDRRAMPNTGRFSPQRRDSGMNRGFSRDNRREETQFSSFESPAEKKDSEPAVSMSQEENKIFFPIMKELKGSLKARLFDKNMKQKGESEVRELIQKIKNTKGTNTIVFDGIITKRLAEESEKLGVETLVGIKKGWFKSSGKIKILTVTA